jgi:hypothetical protein
MFNYLNVRAGERPLEPFGEGAVFGDVAYHFEPRIFIRQRLFGQVLMVVAYGGGCRAIR